MPRYKLVIEYDGGPFCGWQRQADDPTVQAAIETAVTRFSGEAARLTCAGRTDAGVHAIHQVAHLDLAKDWRTDTVRDALNAHLRPQPVSILSAELVTEAFDARHSAIRRHYRYRILNRRSPAALTRAHVWHVPWALDAGLMHEAAQGLLGFGHQIGGRLFKIIVGVRIRPRQNRADVHKRFKTRPEGHPEVY